MPTYKEKKGFSLVETLISLMIVSLILSAAMPLITIKKKAATSTSTTTTTSPTAQETILLCNNGNESACATAYSNAWNRSCYEVLSSWPAAITGNYNLTPNGSSNPVLTACNMTNTASSAISGCNVGNSLDCYYGYTGSYNRGCNQIASSWSGATAGTYKLTPNGSESPVSTACSYLSTPAIASISGCNVGNANDCTYGYTNNTNRGCTQILQTAPELAETGNYNITSSTTAYASKSCNMTSMESAAITGCNAGNAIDCAYGYTNSLNQTCAQIQTAFLSAPWSTTPNTSTYNLSTSSAGAYTADATCKMIPATPAAGTVTITGNPNTIMVTDYDLDVAGRTANNGSGPCWANTGGGVC